MKNLSRVLLAAPFCGACALALIAACTSDSGGNAVVPDAGTTPEAGADTSMPPSDAATDTTQPPMDAAQDSACTTYMGALPNDAGAQCHDLVSNAPSIQVTVDPGALPVGTGGTLGDGLYYLTEARIYPGSPVPSTTTVKYAVLVVGDMSYIVDDNGATVRRTTKKNPDGGPGIILCETKTDNNPPAGSQTATCNTLQTYDSNSLFSTKFVKQ